MSTMSFYAYPDAIVSPFRNARIVTAKQASREHVERVAAKLPEPQRTAFLRGAGMFDFGGSA